MPTKTKLLFFGSDSFGLQIFSELIGNSSMNVLAIVTRSPKPSGRGLKPAPNPLITEARQQNVSIVFTEKPDDWTKVADTIKKNHPDYAVVANFGKIIPKEILDIMPNAFINIHPSLLPKYRGPSPIETAIINGDKTTGVSFIILGEKMDAGPLLKQHKLRISAITAADLETKLGGLAAKNIANIIDDYKANRLKMHNQIEGQATYTHFITKQDGLIIDNEDADTIDRKYRAYVKWPGIYFNALGKQFKIIAGKKRNGYFTVSQIQPESKKVLSAKEFINGYKEVLTHTPKFVTIV